MCVCGRVLVGAPQAKAIGKQKSKVTGGIYKCELDSDKCNRIIFDDNGKTRFPFLIQLNFFCLFKSKTEFQHVDLLHLFVLS